MTMASRKNLRKMTNPELAAEIDQRMTVENNYRATWNLLAAPLDVPDTPKTHFAIRRREADRKAARRALDAAIDSLREALAEETRRRFERYFESIRGAGGDVLIGGFVPIGRIGIEPDALTVGSPAWRSAVWQFVRTMGGKEHVLEALSLPEPARSAEETAVEWAARVFVPAGPGLPLRIISLDGRLPDGFWDVEWPTVYGPIDGMPHLWVGTRFDRVGRGLVVEGRPDIVEALAVALGFGGRVEVRGLPPVE